MKIIIVFTITEKQANILASISSKVPNSLTSQKHKDLKSRVTFVKL